MSPTQFHTAGSSAATILKRQQGRKRGGGGEERRREERQEEGRRRIGEKRGTEGRTGGLQSQRQQYNIVGEYVIVIYNIAMKYVRYNSKPTAQEVINERSHIMMDENQQLKNMGVKSRN